MAENTKTEELREKIANLVADDFACTRVWSAWDYGTMTRDDFEQLSETGRVDEIQQLINSAVHQALDTVQTSSNKGMYIGDRAADVLANHRKVVDEAIEAERNKYPLNKEES